MWGKDNWLQQSRRQCVLNCRLFPTTTSNAAIRLPACHFPLGIFLITPLFLARREYKVLTHSAICNQLINNSIQTPHPAASNFPPPVCTTQHFLYKDTSPPIAASTLCHLTQPNNATKFRFLTRCHPVIPTPCHHARNPVTKPVSERRPACSRLPSYVQLRLALRSFVPRPAFGKKYRERNNLKYSDGYVPGLSHQ